MLPMPAYLDKDQELILKDTPIHENYRLEIATRWLFRLMAFFVIGSLAM